MRYKIKYFLPVVIATIIACRQDQKAAHTPAPIFPKGEKNTNENFVGEVWVKSLVDADSVNETAVGNVTFAPGARSKWHLHPAC